MKIICQKCTAQYEVQESAIPSSGGMMRCPACLNTFLVKPPAAGGDKSLGILGHGEEEFTPPAARAHRPAGRAPGPQENPQAPADKPGLHPLPPMEGMVSPISPVRPSTHDTSHEAELPVPKRSARGDHPYGVRPSGAFETIGRKTEAADLPAPKRPVGKPSQPMNPGREDAAPVLIPPAPTSAPLVVPPPGLSRGRMSAANLADLPAPVGPTSRNLPELPAPVGPTSRNQAELPAPVGPTSRNLPELPAPVGPTSRNLPELPAPVGPTSRNQPELPAPKGRTAPLSLELDLELDPGGTAELPAPVAPELPMPVAPELVEPVRPELVSPVHPGLLSPVASLRSGPSDRSGPADPLQRSGASGSSAHSGPFLEPQLSLEGPGSQDSLGIELADLPPPPPRVQAVPTLDTLSAWPPRGPQEPDPVLDDGPELLTVPLPAAASIAPAPSLVSSRRSAIPPSRPSNQIILPSPIDPLGDEVSEQLTQPILPDDELPPLPLEAPSGPALHAEDDLLGDGEGTAPLLVEGEGGEGPPPEAGQADELASAASPVLGDAPAEPKGPEKKPLARKSLLWRAFAAAAGVLLLGGISGYFLLLHPSLSSVDQAAADQARKLLVDDTLPSDRKAADKLHDIAVKSKGQETVLGLEAQARLCAARYGVSAELRTADERLNQVPKDSQDPEVIKARGLRELLNNKPAEARRLLEPMVRTAPGRKDPMAPVYMGWTEMQAGKSGAAEKAFRAALNVDPRAVAALYGTAQVKEKTGARDAAYATYGQVLKVRPDHFGALFGQVRTGPKKQDEAGLLAAINRYKTTASGRDLAEAWTLLATWAMDHSQQKEAEERLRKALGADVSLVTAQVGLARILCQQDKFQEAAELAHRATKADPANVEGLLTLVRALLGSKKPLDAGAPLVALARLAPKDARVYYWQGRREEDVAAADSDDKAALSYHKALELDGKYLDAYIALSRVLSHQGKSTDALAALKQAAAQAQGDPELANALGEAHLGAGDVGKAEEAFRLALAKKPDFNKARMNLAVALEQRGALEEAEKELSALHERDKNYPGLTERRAAVLLRQGRYDQAETLYLMAAGQPGASERLRLDAVQYTLKNHPDEARALAEAVLRENVRSARAHGLLATLEMAREHLPDAALQIDLAYRMGNSPEIELTRGRILLAQGRKQEGIIALASARKPPVEGLAMGLHARQLMQQGLTKEALDEVSDLTSRKKALFADPSIYRPKEVSAILGDAYLLLGDLQNRVQHEEQALHAFENATRELPDSGEAAFQYGRSLYVNGKKPQAIQELQRSLELGGDTVRYALEAYLLLGDSYRERRQRAEAVRAYKKWLSLAPASAPEQREVARDLLQLGVGVQR